MRESRVDRYVSEARYVENGIQVTWDPASRLVHLVYQPIARPGGEEALKMQAWINDLVGTELPFSFLIDVAGADEEGAVWRYRWVSWFYAHRARMHVAVIHADRIGSTVIEAFRLSTRTKVRTFPSEPEARSWLGTARQDGPSTPRSL